MRCKALKSFFYRDDKTARMVTAKKGEELTLDHVEQGPIIFELLQGGRIEVIDDAFIPQRGRYQALTYISYKTRENFGRVSKPGDEIELDQSTASQYLISGHVRPLNEKAWKPARLLGDTVKTDTVKRMFDTEEPPKENFLRKWRR